MKALDCEMGVITRGAENVGLRAAFRWIIKAGRPTMTTNPLDDSDETRLQRIRERAYHLWEQEGRPEGRDVDYWERARELVGMEESPSAGQITVRRDIPEEASIQENQGEFPGRFTDQGDQQAVPTKKSS
jgi:hypothetical protein